MSGVRAPLSHDPRHIIAHASHHSVTLPRPQMSLPPSLISPLFHTIENPFVTALAAPLAEPFSLVGSDFA